MKKVLIIILIFVLALSTMSCSNSLSPEDEAKKVATDYMTVLYTIEEFTELSGEKGEETDLGLEGDRRFELTPEMLKALEMGEALEPYATPEHLSGLMDNRYMFPVIYYALKRQCNLSLDRIEFETTRHEEDRIQFNYEATVKLANMAGKEEYITVEGIVGLKKTDDVWKVYADKSVDYFEEFVIHDHYNVQTEMIEPMIVETTKDDAYSELEAYVDRLFFAVHNTTDEKQRLNYQNSGLYVLVLYEDGKEVYRSSARKEPEVNEIDKGESMVFVLNYPLGVPAGEYEYEFYIEAEGWEHKEHLKGIVEIESK